MASYLYFWARFFDDTANERRKIYKLNQNSGAMEHIAPGDQVLAVANISGEYELVAIFQVTAVGENHPSDPDYHEYGQFFFEADPSISRYTDPARRISADSAIRASRLTTNAKILGHSFRGKNGVRRLSNQEAKQIIATAL